MTKRRELTKTNNNLTNFWEIVKESITYESMPVEEVFSRTVNSEDQVNNV